MGAWGTAIFSDDLAADVRDEWRQHIAHGMDAAAATDALVTSFSDAIEDADDRNVFWLSLALTQWKTGRLLDSVRDHALAVIDNGDDLARWDSAHRRARERVLAKARETLVSPQPEPKRIRARFVSATPYEVGDVLQVDLADGRRMLLAVVDHVQGATGDRAPIVVALRWLGTADDRPPNLEGLELTRPAFAIGMVNKRGEADPERVRLVGRLSIETSRQRSYGWTWWQDLDTYLTDDHRPKIGL